MSLTIAADRPKAPSAPAPTIAAAADTTRGPQTLRCWLQANGLSASDAVVLVLVGVFIMLIAIGACGLIALSNADAARWGPRLLSLERGFLETGALLAGGLAMVASIAAAERGRRTAVIGLATALLCGLAYLAMLGIDYDSLYYHRLMPGDGFRPNERWVARKFGASLPEGPLAAAAPLATARPVQRIVDAVNGRRLFLGTCATCHGASGEGMPGQGKDLRVSQFVHDRSDADLLKFVIAGRQPWDPENTTKVAMPGRGGNPMLSDADLKDIVAHLRSLQQSAVSSGNGASATTAANSSSAPASKPVRTPEQMEEDKVFAALAAPRWVVPPPPGGPRGVSQTYLANAIRPDWRTPGNAQSFFGVFLFATQVAGVHVLITCVAIGVLIYRLLRRRVERTGQVADHRASIIATGALWWWTTACWVCMFLLLHVNR